jgi:peptidylprolyl isomerase
MKALLAVLVFLFPIMASAADAENTLLVEITGQANGTVEIELFPDLAPKHVAQVKELARSGAYNNVVFHRVIEGFMAQTGDVEWGTIDTFSSGRAGTGGSELPNIDAEFSREPFKRGVVGMARAQNPNSANSQFFIMFADGDFLNGQYTVFGRVVSGMEIVDAIKRGDSAQNGTVSDEPDYMSSVTIKADG